MVRISDHLPKGQEGAIPAAVIQEKLELTPKQFRRRVQMALFDGVPAFSKGGSWYISDDPDEILKRARAWRRRGERALKIAKALETPILEERRKRFAREYNAE